jgi:hypothetical protein
MNNFFLTQQIAGIGLPECYGANGLGIDKKLPGRFDFSRFMDHVYIGTQDQ